MKVFGSIKSFISALNVNIKYLTPVEWAEENRVLTKDITPWPGKVDYSRTPYMKEFVNTIMPDNDKQVITFMKSSQMGVSIVGIFTLIGWIIDQDPANALFITETDIKIKDQMQGPINQMINSSGLAEKVGNHNIREREAKGRRKSASGDTMAGINYTGGRLYTWSGQNIGKLSSWSVKYSICDEVERYKLADKNAGHFFSLIEPRHQAYEETKKMYFVSTPEIKQTSRIEPLYLKGDQRKYHLPCKCCGEMIDLRWYELDKSTGKKHGVLFEREPGGKLIKESVRYRCQKCGGEWPQTHVYDCYEEDVCKWIATAEPFDESYTSYHISTLYAPAGMTSWEKLALKWCSIHPVNGAVKIEELKAFINQELGQTWEEQTKKVNATRLIKNTFNYEIATIPTQLAEQQGNGKIVLITCAVDLNGKIDDARLDYEIKAWCENESSYSIIHGSIGTFQRSKLVRSGQAERVQKEDEEREKWTYRHGAANSVWPVLDGIINKKYATDEGKEMPVAFIGVDSGHFTSFVYQYVNARAPRVMSLKGPSDNPYTNFDANKKLFRVSNDVPNLYLPDVNLIKDKMSKKIDLPWNESDGIDQPSGFLNFPYSEGNLYTMKHYFSHWEAEERDIKLNEQATAIGSRWVNKHGKPNHFYDCHVYNEAVKEIVTDMICKMAKVPVSFVNLSRILG